MQTRHWLSLSAAAVLIGALSVSWSVQPVHMAVESATHGVGGDYRVTIYAGHGDTIYFPNPDSSSLNWLPKTGGSGVADSSVAVPWIFYKHQVGTARCTLFVFSTAVPAGIDTVSLESAAGYLDGGSWGGVRRKISKCAVAVHGGAATDTIAITATD